jgi:hypothetical protein
MEEPFPAGEEDKPLHVHIEAMRRGRREFESVGSALQGARTPPDAPKKRHRWRSKESEKRTIAVPYKPSERAPRYLSDMKHALTMVLAQGYALAETNPEQKIPGPVPLRRKVKPWFDSCCGA